MNRFAWVRGGFRPVYAIREIRRGKSKGKFEIEYRANGNVFRKKIVSKSDLKLGEEFNNDLRGKRKRI